MDDRLLAALRVMFSRSKKELEGKTAKQLGRYKVCTNNNFLNGIIIKNENTLQL